MNQIDRRRVVMAKRGYTSIIVEVYDSGHVGGKHGTRHIRPIKDQPFSQSLDVECDSTLASNPIGTRFRMYVKLKYREGSGEHLYSYWGWQAERIQD
jgi:hypothetical protein